MNEDMIRKVYKSLNHKLVPSVIVVIVNIILKFVKEKLGWDSGYYVIAVIPVLYYILMWWLERKYIKGISFYLNKGALIDEKSGAVNVSLRKTTLEIIFNELKNEGKGNNNSKMFDIGRKIGVDFGDFLSKKDFFKSVEGDKKNIENCIKKWLEYDSTSGMGAFELKDEFNYLPDKIGNYLIPNEFYIQIQNSFLNDNNCDFARGYITGVIKEILDRTNGSFHITVKKNCGKIKCNNHLCNYKIIVNYNNKVNYNKESIKNTEEK